MMLLPWIMGALMGPMLLMMAHGPLVTGTTPVALISFVLAHLAVIAGLVFALSRWPALRRRLHRPSFGHLSRMVFAALTSATVVHLIHGGPA